MALTAVGPPPGLDPQMWAILRAQPPLASLEPTVMRAHARTSKLRWNTDVTGGLRVEDGHYPARGGHRPIRRLMADERMTHAAGTVVHVHGGGWATCDPDTHLSILAELARATRRPVLAPHPRHAPQFPHPMPLQDVVDALRHVAVTHPGGIYLSGDSAGANLALAAVLWLRDRGEELPVRAIALHYGCFRRRFDTTSHLLFGDGRYGLNTEKMRAFWDLYLDHGIDSGYGDLAGAAMHGLPPMQIHVAGADILRDDSLWLARRVQSAGGSVDMVEWPGMAHGFLHYPRDLDAARDAPRRVAGFFDRHPGVTP